MKSAHARAKQPDRVRRELLAAATRIAVEQGLAKLTLQMVSDAARVTKGGLLHHFPNKQALVEAMFADLLVRLDAQIDAAIAESGQVRGCFTRAYLASVVGEDAAADARLWAALSISMLSAPGLREAWARWLAERLERHAGTDGGPLLALVRYTADGIWLSQLLDNQDNPEQAGVAARLITMMEDES